MLWFYMEKQTVPKGAVCFIMEIIEDDCPFLSDQKGTKESPRGFLRWTPRLRRVSIGVAPWTPITRGRPPISWGNFIRRAKSEWLVLLAAGPLGPPGSKFKTVCAVRTPPTPAQPGQLGSHRGPLGPIPPVRGKWPQAKRGRDHRPLQKGSRLCA